MLASGGVGRSEKPSGNVHGRASVLISWLSHACSGNDLYAGSGRVCSAAIADDAVAYLALAAAMTSAELAKACGIKVPGRDDDINRKKLCVKVFLSG